MGQNKYEIKQLEWIVDSWISYDGKNGESWERTNESEYTGKGWSMANGKKNIFEKLSIKTMDNEIYYIADTEHNAAPVYFKLYEITGNKAVFENKEHDFPKIITYILEEPDKLLAIIEGTDMKTCFYFTRSR